MHKNRQGLTEQEFLEQYNPAKYDRPSVTVDMLIFTVIEDKLKLLMIKRADHPFIGQWALPGGFVNMDEDLDTAAARELEEETGLDNIYMQQLYTWGEINRDPRTRIITVAYMALVDSSTLSVKAADDAADAKWFDVILELEKKDKQTTPNSLTIQYYYKLILTCEGGSADAVIKVDESYYQRNKIIHRHIVKTNQIASDHSKIIEHGLEALKDKVKHSEIIFNLLPDAFEMGQLKSIYEAIIEQKVSEKYIFDKFSKMLIPSNEQGKYKYNPKYMEKLL